jgi:hypothetical protein
VATVTWLVPLAVAALGATALAAALRRCLGEIAPLRDAFARSRADVAPALVRVRSETDAARERLARHPRA